MAKTKFCSWCGTELVRGERGGVERILCPADGCGYVYWNNPLPVVAGIVEYEGEVILTQNKGWPKHWFGVVTGFLERKELPESGILRELKEELGLEGEVVEFIGVYPFLERNELIIAYHVRAWGEIVLGEELAAYKRVPIDKLKPWPFATGLAVKDWLAKRRS